MCRYVYTQVYLPGKLTSCFYENVYIPNRVEGDRMNKIRIKEASLSTVPVVQEHFCYYYTIIKETHKTCFDHRLYKIKVVTEEKQK